MMTGKTPRTYLERVFQKQRDGLITLAQQIRKNDPPFTLEEADGHLSNLVRFFGIDKEFDRAIAGAIVKAHQVFGRIPPLTEHGIVVFLAAIAKGKARYDDVIHIRVRSLPNNRMPMEKRLAIVRDVDAAPGDTKYDKFCYVAALRHKTPEAIKKMYYQVKKGNDELHKK
jgi:hypothetical protein